MHLITVDQLRFKIQRAHSMAVNVLTSFCNSDLAYHVDGDYRPQGFEKTRNKVY